MFNFIFFKSTLGIPTGSGHKNTFLKRDHLAEEQLKFAEEPRGRVAVRPEIRDTELAVTGRRGNRA